MITIHSFNWLNQPWIWRTVFCQPDSCLGIHSDLTPSVDVFFHKLVPGTFIRIWIALFFLVWVAWLSRRRPRKSISELVYIWWFDQHISQRTGARQQGTFWSGSEASYFHDSWFFTSYKSLWISNDYCTFHSETDILIFHFLSLMQFTLNSWIENLSF